MTKHCKCPGCGWNHYGAKDFAATCQRCGTHFECGEPFVAREIDLEAFYAEARAHWEKLHRFAFSDEWENRCRWWDEWQANIPSVGCSCRQHWKELVEEMPPDFSSREAFFRWTVAAHNNVNMRLGKPIVSLKEAMRLHGAAGGVE